MKKRSVYIIFFVYISAFIIGLAIGKFYAENNSAKAEIKSQANINEKEEKRIENISNKEHIKHYEKKLDNEENNKQQVNISVSSDKKDIDSINNKKVNEVIKKSSKKIAYLTFDDGPSQDVTPKVLEVLNKNGIKGTFFVLGSMVKDHPELLKKIHDDGHAIANHTYTHIYSRVYSSPEVMIEEIKNTEKVIKSVLGDDYNNKFFRFPGGSFGRSKEIKAAVVSSGYNYIDWNCLTGDAEGKIVSVERQYQRFLSTCKNKKTLIILMHDGKGKYTTPEVLDKVINYLKEQGYEFEVLR